MSEATKEAEALREWIESQWYPGPAEGIAMLDALCAAYAERERETSEALRQEVAQCMHQETQLRAMRDDIRRVVEAYAASGCTYDWAGLMNCLRYVIEMQRKLLREIIEAYDDMPCDDAGGTMLMNVRLDAAVGAASAELDRATAFSGRER